MIHVGQIGFDVVYFVNESSDPRDVGDLQSYKTKADMLSYIEPWYEDVGHIVFDTKGSCYKIKAIDQLTTGLVSIKSKVHPDSIDQCIKYFSSHRNTKPKLDISLYPTKIKLIEDHHDYVVEAPSTVKQNRKSFFAQLKFWK